MGKFLDGVFFQIHSLASFRAPGTAHRRDESLLSEIPVGFSRAATVGESGIQLENPLA
jgi:hypothetical protein